MDTKKLRQKILDLAIRGKLVSQDPNDEPASVLLERIREEKERLIAEGKIKRQKKSKASSGEPHYRNFEPPFEIPDSWVWVTINDIGEIVTGNTPPKDVKEYYGGGVPFYKPTDLSQGINTTSASDTLTQQGFVQSRQLPVNSILITCIGATIGKTGLIRKTGSCNQQINAIIPYNCVSPEFVFYLCNSTYFQNCIKENASSTTLPILNKNSFASLLFPLPPLPEQHSIIMVINDYLKIVSDIENGKTELKSAVEICKSKILELAMQGKLVPQDPSDEPAAEMLRRVNPKAMIITDNPHSWNIPSNWMWISVKDIFKPMERKLPSGEQFLYIDIDSIDNKNNTVIPKTISVKTAPSRASRKTTKGDIVFSMVRPYLKNIAIVPEDDCIASTGFYVLSCTASIDPQFAFHIAISDFFVQGLNSFMKGDNSPSINKGNIDKYVIPLPPMNEQKRIVAKIEEIFSCLDEIEASLQS